MTTPRGDLKVSVLVMTYNHVQYIDQAVDSALGQDTNFAFEVLVSEDYSNDGTRERAIEYQSRFPETLKLLLSDRNLKTNAVVARGIEAARGAYIALLDGDDYWISKNKLQKQVDFLDAHPGCSICFHNAMVVDENGVSTRNWTPSDQKEITTLEDIWLGNYMATCSTMFRRGLFGEIPAWYDDLFPITDWPLHILNAEHGDIGYINEVLGAYRYHKHGMYSPLSESEKLNKTMDFYQRMNRNLAYRHDRMIKIAQSKYFFEWAEEYLQRGDQQNARLNFKRCLSGRPVNRFISVRNLIKMALRVYFPVRSVQVPE